MNIKNLRSSQIDCSDTPIPFYPWDAVREAEYILRDHDQYYPLFLQVNFPQMRADYPGQVPPEYLARAANIVSEPRKVFAGLSRSFLKKNSPVYEPKPSK